MYDKKNTHVLSLMKFGKRSHTLKKSGDKFSIIEKSK